MRRRRHSLALPLALVALIALPLGSAAEPSVEVFTLSSLPVSGARDATVYRLDAVAQLEAQLSAGLPADPALAQQLVARRLAELGPGRLEQLARDGAAGLARAAQLGVQRAPAIVFDGRWVVYGTTDVEAARRMHARREER